jgi:hypothetical protein
MYMSDIQGGGNVKLSWWVGLVVFVLVLVAYLVVTVR